MKADLPWQSVWIPLMNASAKEYYSYQHIIGILIISVEHENVAISVIGINRLRVFVLAKYPISDSYATDTI